MTDLDDLDEATRVVHGVDDSVGALAKAIAIVASGESLTAGWARILRETVNAGDDAGENRARLDGLQLLGGGRLDEEAIACHAAEEP